jgi:hypothetical protein
MAIPLAEKLLEQAVAGKKLTSSERRHCVAFLMTTRPETSQVAMGELFQVSERQIRLDKVKIRKDKAAMIKEDDIALVIADIALEIERQIRDLEASKKKCKIGTRPYVSHCQAIMDARLKGVKALQDLGYYPRNLGNMTVEKYEYRAVVGKGGAVQAGPAHLVVDAEFDPIDSQDSDIKLLPGN